MLISEFLEEVFRHETKFVRLASRARGVMKCIGKGHPAINAEALEVLLDLAEMGDDIMTEWALLTAGKHKTMDGLEVKP